MGRTKTLFLLFLFHVYTMACGSCYAVEFSMEQRIAVRVGANLSMRITIVDDEGFAVSDAEIRCGLSLGSDGENAVYGLTDKDGMFDLKGRTDGASIDICVNKPGYYKSRIKFCFADMINPRKVEFNRWQPYGEALVVTLRKIKNPLNFPVLNTEPLEIPYEDVWLEYDFLENDWVSPLGKGSHADIRIKIKGDGLPKWANRKIEGAVEFLGNNNGGYLDAIFASSELKGSYCFDVNRQLTRELNGYRYMTQTGYDERRLLDKGCYLNARIRTKISDDGEVLECYYLRIFSMYIETGNNGKARILLPYVINRTSKDPNLECKRF